MAAAVVRRPFMISSTVMIPFLTPGPTSASKVTPCIAWRAVVAVLECRSAAFGPPPGHRIRCPQQRKIAGKSNRSPGTETKGQGVLSWRSRQTAVAGPDPIIHVERCFYVEHSHKAAESVRSASCGEEPFFRLAQDVRGPARLTGHRPQACLP
jgi:hypothetical protein